MSKINIIGLNENDDPFYRYKMNKLNVIKRKNTTVIDNLKDVAKDVERDPQLLIDYFKKRFSVAFIYKNNILSTTSNLSYDDFYTALREFIEYLVLCEKCHLPETNISIGKIVELKCRSCANVMNKNNSGNKTFKKFIDSLLIK